MQNFLMNIIFPHRLAVNIRSGPIAFKNGSFKHPYVVAKIGKTADASVMTGTEAAKVHCADGHFKALSGGDVRYVVADSCESLLKKMMMQED